MNHTNHPEKSHRDNQKVILLGSNCLILLRRTRPLSLCHVRRHCNFSKSPGNIPIASGTAGAQDCTFQYNLGVLAGTLQPNVGIKKDIQCADKLFKGIIA